MNGMQGSQLAVAPSPGLLALERKPSLKLVGLRGHIQGLPANAIPDFWARFLPYNGWIPGQLDKARYGVPLESEGAEKGFDYLTAVEVEGFQHAHADWDRLEVSSHRYAISPHREHVSQLRQNMHSIFSRALPALNLRPRSRSPGLPIVLERYADSFDLRTGWGDIQVWVPLTH